MFAMGCTLKIADFKRIVEFPKAFLTGVFAQMLLLPFIAFLLSYAFALRPELAVGLMIIACCPGGPTSNILTYIAKGDTALSISLTACVSLLSIFSLPFIVKFSLSHFAIPSEIINLPIAKTILGLFLITTVPVLLGMAVYNKFPSWTANNQKSITRLAGFLFFVLFLGAVLKEKDNIAMYFKQAGLASTSLCLIMIFLSYLLSRTLKLRAKEAIAISIECGLQNGTLALFVALTLIGNSLMSVPAAIYSLLMYPLIFLAMYIFRSKKSIA